MSACPIPKHPSWVRLVDRFGEVDALSIFNVYNFTATDEYRGYPDLNEATTVLEGIKKKLSGKQINDLLVQDKLDRCEKQIQYLETIENRLKKLGDIGAAKVQTISKIKEGIAEYMKILQSSDSASTVSVTNLYSGYDLDLPEAYKNYTNFGIFMHEVVEELQNELIKKDSKSILSLWSKQKFRKIYKDFVKRKYAETKGEFKITNLFDGENITNEDELFNMASDILSTVQTYVSQGYTILPEVTLVGKDRRNRVIIGRSDMLAVNNKGQVVILDFKTKKLRHNDNLSHDPLAKRHQVTAHEDADRLLKEGDRNTYDHWNIQLSLYERLLEQMGVPVIDKYIVSLLYYGEWQGKQIEGDIDKFTYAYYKLMLHRSSLNAFDPVLEKEKIDEFKVMMDIVRTVIPVKDEINENTESNSSNVYDTYDNISAEDAERIISQIITRTDSELSDVIKQIYRLENENRNQPNDTREVVLRYLKSRKDSLVQIKDRLRNKEDESWKSVQRISDIVKTLDIDIKDLIEKSKSVLEDGSLSMLDKATYLSQFSKASASYTSVIAQVQQIFVNANVDPSNKAFAMLSELMKNINIVDANYLQIGFNNLMDILSQIMTDDAAERLDKTMVAAYKPEIERLKKKAQKLRDAGQTSRFWTRIANSVTNTLTGQEKEPENDLERTELEILNLEAKLKGLNFKDSQKLKEYIYNVTTNDDSLNYIGKNATFWTDIIAGASSSDPVLSSFTNKLKIATSNAVKEYINFIEREGIQDELDKIRRMYPDNDSLNKAISQVHSQTFVNSEGKIETKETRSFTRPWAQEYYDVFYNYFNKSNLLVQQILAANNEDERVALRKELADLKDSHLQWRLANTQMPFVREFYEMDNLLPEDFRQKRAEIYSQINQIRNSHGFNNADLLSDEETWLIREKETELSKLEKEYLDTKPEGWERYMELKEKFFSYEPDYDHFTRLRNQKIAELTDENGQISAENQKRLDRWDRENTYDKPTDEWYQTVADIYDQIFEILGERNPDMEALYTERRAILKQYRFKGAVDSTLITDDDLNKLEEIDALIDEVREGNGKLELTYEQSQMLNNLFRTLEVIQTKRTSPFYQQKYDESVENLEVAWENFQSETDPAAKEQALSNFLLVEQEFAEWYNKNHLNKYVSKLSLKNKGLNPIPKSYNLMSWPTSEDMLEKGIPDFKFSVRKLKQAAYNILYQEDAENIPLPLGVYVDQNSENTQDVPVRFFGSSKWFNPEYTEIRSNPELDEFYHSFVGRFLRVQQDSAGRGLGYNFPGYVIDSIDDYREKGLKKGFQNRMRLMKDQFFQNQYYDYLNHGFIGSGPGVVFKHNVSLPLNEQSPDGIGSVVKWFEEAKINQSMANAAVLSESTIKFLRYLYTITSNSAVNNKEEKLKGLSTIIETMQAEYNKFVKGEYKQRENALLSRGGDLLLRGLGFSRLAFDLPNQIGNLFSGNVQAFLGTHKSGHYSFKNYRWAKSKFYDMKDGFLVSAFRDFNKIGKKSRIIKMFYYFNPQQEQVSENYDRAKSGKRRLAQGVADMNFNFAIQNSGELEIAATVWLSIMDHNGARLVKSRDENGKITEYVTDENGNDVKVNIYDAYRENENGEIVIRDDVDWDEKREEQLQKIVWSEVRRTQGNYGKWDRTKFEQKFIGRLVVFYRKYLEPAVRNRYGRLEPDYETGDMRMGTYWGLINAIRNFGWLETAKMIFGKQLKDDDLGYFYQRKSQSAAKELGTGLAISMISTMILAALPEDDDDLTDLERLMLYNLVAVWAKVDMETRSLIPEPFFIGRPQEYITNFSDLTNAGRDIGRAMNFAVDMSFWISMKMAPDGSAVEEALAKKALYQRKTKLFEKGDPKWRKELYQMTGFMNGFELFNPEERVKNFKSTIN